MSDNEDDWDKSSGDEGDEETKNKFVGEEAVDLEAEKAEERKKEEEKKKESERRKKR